MSEQDLIAQCLRQERRAQRLFYERYAPAMLGVCLRYIKQHEDAEDVLVEALFKALSHIGAYQGKGSFEGWVRRIVVNECLMFLRKRNDLKYAEDITQMHIGQDTPVHDELAALDILNVLERLPAGYRTVFNLYVIEGYKHREIADLLGISINTSKSQLILAKKRLQELLSEHLND